MTEAVPGTDTELVVLAQVGGSYDEIRSCLVGMSEGTQCRLVDLKGADPGPVLASARRSRSYQSHEWSNYGRVPRACPGRPLSTWGSR